MERLRVLHDFYRMGEEEYFSFDFEEAVKVGRDYKDDICNGMLKIYPTYMQDEKRFAKALFIRKYPSSLSDRFLTELATVPAHTVISIDVAPIPKDVTTSKGIRAAPDALLWIKIHRYGILTALSTVTTWVQAPMPCSAYQVMAVVKYSIDNLEEWDFRTRNHADMESYNAWMEELQGKTVQ